MSTHDPVRNGDRQRPLGVGALVILFVAAAAAGYAGAFSILRPGTAVDALWRMNPTAWRALHQVEPFAVALLSCAASTSLFSAVGLWRGAAWGRMLALVVLVETGLAATAQVVIDGDPRGIIAQPIVAPLIAYLLLNTRVDRFFRAAREHGYSFRGKRERAIRYMGS
ncbi:MAG TPA: hypothetical protein VHC69_03595 [Polyangiaceae bacterium]|nr:hypothetical protein [Polyangiaceae bacterium]